MIKEILSAEPSDAGVRIVLDGILYFMASTSGEGLELWETDGTTAGTEALDVNPGQGNGSPGGLKAIDGQIFFWANHATHGFRPWVLN
jgi:ELWxxDGT repeat protein